MLGIILFGIILSMSICTSLSGSPVKYILNYCNKTNWIVRYHQYVAFISIWPKCYVFVIIPQRIQFIFALYPIFRHHWFYLSKKCEVFRMSTFQMSQYYWLPPLSRFTFRSRKIWLKIHLNHLVRNLIWICSGNRAVFIFITTLFAENHIVISIV